MFWGHWTQDGQTIHPVGGLVMSGEYYLKIIIRRLGMNRIQRINIFLQDYKSLNPYLKNILNEVQEDFQKELIKEYLKVSRHPFENEYLSVP